MEMKKSKETSISNTPLNIISPYGIRNKMWSYGN